MSSPVNDDSDKRVMYAPPWAREAPQQPQQPPQAIVAAIERLRLERLKAAAPLPKEPETDETDTEPRSHEDDRDQPELPLTQHKGKIDIDIEAAVADAVRASWRTPSLEPVTMPEPPKPRLDGPTWGMFIRLGGAVGVAAVVALFVTGVVPLPSIGISLSSTEGAKAASPAIEAFGRSDTRGPRQPLAVADVSTSAPAPSAPAPASVPAANAPSSGLPQPGAVPSEILTAFASLNTSAAVPPPAPLGPKIETQPAAATPVPNLPEVRPLDRDELAGLVKRGQAFLAEGDISSARLLLRRAAEAGDPVAALTLAGTYDRAELAKLKVLGVAPDHAQARIWYTKAVEHGSAEAVRRLQQLAQRAD